MKSNKKVVVIDATIAGWSLFKHHFHHVLIVLTLQVMGVYFRDFIIKPIGYVGTLRILPYYLLILLMNLSLLVAIKGTMNQKPVKILEAISQGTLYITKGILGSVLTGVTYIMVILCLEYLLMLMPGHNQLAIYISQGLVASAAFFLAFVLQGIVIKDMNPNRAWLNCLKIFKNNLLNFLGLGFLALVFMKVMNSFILPLDIQSSTLGYMFMSFLSYFFCNVALFVITAMFYQVSQDSPCDTSSSQEAEGN